MFDDGTLNERYPILGKHSDPVKAAERTIVGRENEVRQLLSSMSRPELCNALLLAPAGAGKSALVQAAMLEDSQRVYMEVDVSRMIASVTSVEQFPGLLKAFFDEAERYVLDEHHQLVLFMDEFHQIMQLSPAAVEALKPILAASGTRGLRIIAATTYDEFKTHIAPNQPLVERLQRINLTPTDKATTISILRGMAVRYEVADEFYDDHVFELIYDYTQRFVPASSQPRKSILVLDSMVGWHRFTHRAMDRNLLADVLMESVGVNIAFRLDAVNIKSQLDTKVFAQDYATRAVAERLQLCVADLHNKSRPLSSFLFSGPTGVGKTELTKQLSRLLFGDDQRRLVRFDMSEYAQDSSLAAFRSELTAKVWSLGHAVILFDEVEKASGMVTRLLLQVLDDARLSDDNGREVSFLNCYIVLTTNSGSEVYKSMARWAANDTGNGDNFGEYMKLIRTSIIETSSEGRFPPELLGRIDAIVPFQPLSEETQKAIVRTKLRVLVQEVLTKHNATLVVGPKVLQFLVQDKGDSETDAGGARASISMMTTEVTTRVAAFLNAYPEERRLRVDVEGDMASDHKDMLKGTAVVKVTATQG